MIPKTAAGMKAHLSKKFQKALKNPKYHQKMEEFTYNYPEVGQCNRNSVDTRKGNFCSLLIMIIKRL